jgi:hypothetical protein
LVSQYGDVNSHFRVILNGQAAFFFAHEMELVQKGDRS